MTLYSTGFTYVRFFAKITDKDIWQGIFHGVILLNLLIIFQTSKFISIALTPREASAAKYPKAFEVVLLNATGGAK